MPDKSDNEIKKPTENIEEPEKKDEKVIEESNKQNSNMNKELYWFFGVMISLLALFFISYYFFQSLLTFTYHGITFEKIKEADVTFYHAIVPVKTLEEQTLRYHLYFRYDPRKNNVPIEGEIAIPKESPVYLSINETGIRGECDDAAIAVASLSQFLREAGGFEVRAAVPDEELAPKLNLPFADCTTNPTNTVLIIQKGNETGVLRKAETNCYTMNIANCEILRAVEKFELEMILQARARAGII